MPPLCSRFPLVVLLTAWMLTGCDRTKPVESVRPAMVVQPKDTSAGLTAYAGEVHARAEPPLAFRVGGKIARRLVDAGTRVKAGQALAELDTADVNLQQEVAHAQLVSAQSELALAKAEFERYKRLFDRQLVSRSLYESRDAAYRAAAARMRQANAQASVAENQTAYAVLRAPADGIITTRMAEAGQVVAAGQALFVLAVNGEREVVVSIPEQDVNAFQIGRGLVVEFWATPGKRFPGKLREISPAADPVTRTYAARVSFSADNTPVELGQSARVYAQQSGKASLSLPLSALTQDHGRSAVWVVDPTTSKVRLTPIQVGAYTEAGVPVLSGLKPEDWVVSAGAHLLLEGERVVAIDRNNRPVMLAPSTRVTTATH